MYVVPIIHNGQNSSSSQTQADIDVSERMRAAIPAYMHWKYEADKNLSKRTAFKWSILRPGGLTNNPGTGKASIGITHITESISVSNLLPNPTRPHTKM